MSRDASVAKERMILRMITHRGVACADSDCADDGSR